MPEGLPRPPSRRAGTCPTLPAPNQTPPPLLQSPNQTITQPAANQTKSFPAIIVSKKFQALGKNNKIYLSHIHAQKRTKDISAVLDFVDAVDLLLLQL